MRAGRSGVGRTRHGIGGEGDVEAIGLGESGEATDLQEVGFAGAQLGVQRLDRPDVRIEIVGPRSCQAMAGRVEEGEVVVGTARGTVYALSDGSELWSAPLSARPSKSMAIADLRGDAESEVVALTEDGLLHFLDSDGDLLVDAVPIPGSGCSSPFAADLTGDGAIEACVASCVGQVFAFGFGGTADEPVVEWQGTGGNLARNGIHVQPFAGSIAAGATLSGRYLILSLIHI